MRRLLCILVLALAAVACGDDDTSGTDAAAGDVTVDASPDDASPDDSSPDDSSPDDSSPDDASPDDASPDDGSPTDGDQPADVADDAGSPDEGGDPFVFAADLDGSGEVPGPGHASATGRIEVESGVDGAMCFDMIVTGLDSVATAAHIHEGAAGVSGGVVIDIGPPTESLEESDVWRDVCVFVDEVLVEQIAANPESFYANVHTETFGAGAVRGQLATATIFDLTLS